MVSSYDKASRKHSKIDIQIAAHEWAEFLYNEYLRERDVLKRSMRMGHLIMSNINLIEEVSSIR